MKDRGPWVPVCGVACCLAALGLDAWVWFAPFSHMDEPKIAAALLLACKAVLGAAVCTEVERRRRGWASSTFWGLLLLALSAGCVTWISWKLIV